MEHIWNEYRDRQVVVTGAASGMGEAVTKFLVTAGAKVSAIDIKPISQDGVTAISADFTDADSIDAAANQITQPLDAVFCCAGLAPVRPPADVVLVNYFANVRLISRLLPLIGKGGAIATIASLPTGWEQIFPKIAPGLEISDFAEARAWVDANVAEVDGTGYMMSKYALIAWTILNAPRLMADHGVRLNTLAPGKTETPMMGDFRKAASAGLDALPVPAGRSSTPEEQANAMMFLNSPLSSYLVGAVLSNDGGSAAALLGGFLRQN